MASASAKKGKAAEIQSGLAEAAVVTTRASKPADVVTSIANLGVSIQDHLRVIQGQLAGRLADVETATLALETQKQKLAETFQVEATLFELDAAKLALEEAREAYKQDQLARNQAREEEEADYKHRTDRERRIEAADYAEQLAVTEKEDNADFEMREAALRERTLDLEAREAELDALKAATEAFPTQLAEAVAKAEAIARNQVKGDAAQAAKLADMEAKHAKALADQTIEGLNAQIVGLKYDLAAARVVVETAQARTADIAKAAVDSASGRESRDSVMQAQSVAASARPAGR